MKDDIKDALNKLGYTPLWFEYNILTINQLHQQSITFDKSDDKNTEHYRYQTLLSYLEDKGKLTDKELNNFLAITFADNDKFMAGAATADIFKCIDLTDSQFQMLCEKIGYFGEWTQKLVARQRKFRDVD